MSRLSLTKNLRILLALGTSNAPTAGIISCVGTGSHAPGRGLKLSFRSRFNADEGDLPRSGMKLSIEETLCKYDIFFVISELDQLPETGYSIKNTEVFDQVPRPAERVPSCFRRGYRAWRGSYCVTAPNK
jgi:hypothetical protein